VGKFKIEFAKNFLEDYESWKKADTRTLRKINALMLGDRLPITGAVEGNILGDALHAIFAAEFIHPQHPERLIAIKRILGAYNLDQNIKAEDVDVMLDRFAALLDRLFQPQTILVERSRHRF
jgi:hypothetical protein